MPSSHRRRSNSAPIRATNMHAVAKRRTKQNSANSLDDFWGSIDEVEYTRSAAVVAAASPRSSKSERSHIKQLSSQTDKTVDASIEYLPPSLRQIEFVGEKARMTKVEERNATVAGSSSVAAKDKSDKKDASLRSRLFGCIWKGKSKNQT
jgi:hypothetical protein